VPIRVSNVRIRKWEPPKEEAPPEEESLKEETSPEEETPTEEATPSEEEVRAEGPSVRPAKGAAVVPENAHARHQFLHHSVFRPNGPTVRPRS
jgi:hypothetical protein